MPCSFSVRGPRRNLPHFHLSSSSFLLLHLFTSFIILLPSLTLILPFHHSPLSSSFIVFSLSLFILFHQPPSFPHFLLFSPHHSSSSFLRYFMCSVASTFQIKWHNNTFTFQHGKTTPFKPPDPLIYVVTGQKIG